MAQNNRLQSRLQERSRALQKQNTERETERTERMPSAGRDDGRTVRDMKSRTPETERPMKTASSGGLLKDRMQRRGREIPEQPEQITYLNGQPLIRSTDDVMMDTEEPEEALNVHEAMQARRERKREQAQKSRGRFLTILLVIGCVYLAFLIYGAINTDYVYNDKGMVVAEKLSVNELKKIKEYEKIAVQYRQARAIYEQILLLDYRVAAGIEDPIAIGPEYEKILNGEITALATQLGGVQVTDEYNQTLNLLNTWVKTDIAVYCQNMSAALSQNSSTYLEQALEYNAIAYNDFSLITQNITTLGSAIAGVDITDFVEWSPEKWVSEQTGGNARELNGALSGQ